MTFNDKVAVVTGAGRGIGRAVCLELGRHGAVIAALDREVTGASETCRIIAEAGGKASPFPYDPADHAQGDRTVSAVLASLGDIDILVNTAEAPDTAAFTSAPPDAVTHDIAVHLSAHIWVTQAVARHMVARGSGKIVNVASDAALLGAEGAAVYAAAGGGLISLTKSLAKELARHRINVNCVCPGPVDLPGQPDTVERDPQRARALLDRIPAKRLAKPEEIAAAVVFLCSDAAAYVTGLVLGVDGGLTRAP